MWMRAGMGELRVAWQRMSNRRCAAARSPIATGGSAWKNEKTSISSDASGIGKGRKNRVAGTSRAVTRRNVSSKRGPTALVGM